MKIISNITGIIFLLIVPIVVILLLVLSILFSPSNTDGEKASIYDCGIISIDDVRNAFPIALYLVAILFLVFDVELILVYPLAISLPYVNVIGLWVCIVFLIILTIGFIYEIASGSLNFTSKSPHTRLHKNDHIALYVQWSDHIALYVQ